MEIGIMRKSTVSIVVLVLALMALGTAQAKNEKPKGKDKAKSPVSVEPAAEKKPEELGRRKRLGGAETARRRDREQMARGMMRAEQLRKLDEQIEAKRGRHNEFVGELKAIKELALQEKAEKTAERIQKLIDKHTGLFNEDIRKLEQRRDRIREQAQKYSEERLKRRERLMKRRKEAQEKAGLQGKADKGKGKGQGKGPGKNKAKAQRQDED